MFKPSIFWYKTVKEENVMALAECNTTVGSDGRELLEHGSTDFPIACYEDDFRIADVPWHWHDEWEAVRITRGNCLVAAGNHKAELHEGEGFFIQSGTLHGCWDIHNSGCMFHSIVFHPRLVGGNTDSVFHKRYLRPLLENPTLEWMHFRPEENSACETLRAIEAAWNACSEERPGYEFSVRNALSSLLWQLHCRKPETYSLPSGKTLRDAERIKLMLTFIHENYSLPINTLAIASCAAVSESECLRCFRSTIGTTPIQYLKQHRLHQAAAQLLSTEDKISEIAERCGFQDMSYFTKSFRETKGCSPSEYRKQKPGCG